MIKHNFKIGDKVKLKGSFCGISGNDTGKVVKVKVGGYIRVLWGGDLGRKLGKGDLYPHTPHEIEHIVKVGEQLLFNFMTP